MNPLRAIFIAIPIATVGWLIFKPINFDLTWKDLFNSWAYTDSEWYWKEQRELWKGTQ